MTLAANLTWFGWFYVTLAILGIVAVVAMIGQPRDPITPGEAIFRILFTFAFMWGIFEVGVTHP